jgi:hypothetical protein
MAVLNNSNAISPSGYDINNSLRFRASASAYLNRTFGAPTNNLKWTWSGWVKLGLLSNSGYGRCLFVGGAADSGNNLTGVFYNTSNKLTLIAYSGGVSQASPTTDAVYRDPSAWYHVVCVYDSANATQADRFIFYVNGTRQTVTGTLLPLNLASKNNANSVLNRIGMEDFGTTYGFDGYLAEVNFIDGQALTPSSFGETDTTTGSWKPKAYTGTYGTNGFYLKFSDIATTSGSNAGLGKDFSGNGNYWTTNNISVTAGTTYDAMIDSPTLTSATVANYAVFNPLMWRTSDGQATISQANLRTTGTSTYSWGTISTPSSGKYYWEMTVTAGTSTAAIGVDDGIHQTSATNGNYVVYLSSGSKTLNATTTSYGSSYTTNDVIGVAIDRDANTITFYKNNTSQGSISNTFTGEVMPFVAHGAGWALQANFGQRPFSYTPPTGYKALNTFNLPDSTIKKGNSYMDVLLYSGNGGTQTITGLNFQPTLVWGKSRSNAIGHNLFDQVRGGNRQLASEITDAEVVRAGNAVLFNSNGITLNATYCNINNSSTTNVAWNWIGGGTGSSNTSGSITSTVSVNATAGFSVLTYTGTGANATVGHGLGVAPAMFILKARSASGLYWVVYHKSVGATKALFLQLTDAANTDILYFNNTAPTSSVLSLGAGSSPNQNGTTFVAYCWAEIAGFSKFGSYTGNGSSDGVFVYTGFRPKYVMIKRTDTSGYSWIVEDTSRDTYNVSSARLIPNTADAEATGTHLIDFLSNGFKLRGTSLETNGSGGTYIYACFASNPFKNSNAR